METNMTEEEKLAKMLGNFREIAKELEGTTLKVDISNVREPDRFENTFDDLRGD